MPDDGNVSLAEAFASADSELGSANPSEPETTLPVADGDEASAATKLDAAADATPDEEQGNDVEALEGFEELFGGDAEAGSVDVSSPEFLETKVTIDTVSGPETLTIAELQKGYMRQADYTRKTQDAAEQRRAATDAVEFYETFKTDPAEFARTIAVRAGLIEEGAQPIKNIEVAKIPTPESLEEMVEQRVQERLQSEPALKEAQLVKAREAVRATFDNIESEHKVKLSDGDRRAVIQEANRRGTTDLGLVFEAMLSRYNSQRSRRGAAPARPTSSATGETPAEERVPQTIAEAFAAAEAEYAGT